MTEATGRGGTRALRGAQLLLVAAAVGLWGASRLPWVSIRSFDGLGLPATTVLSGEAWSPALVPLAVVLVAAAVAAVAVRGWPLRVLAILLGAVSLAAGYLAIGLWQGADVAARAAALAEVPVHSLTGGTERHDLGAGLALAAAVVTVGAAVLVMRAAARGGKSDAKYAAPAARRAATRGADSSGDSEMSERMIWDALDEGRDPTGGPADRVSDPDAEGR